MDSHHRTEETLQKQKKRRKSLFFHWSKWMIKPPEGLAV